MTRLTDLDTILLSAAARRDSGSLLPPPATIGDVGARLAKSIAALSRSGLIEERDTTDQNATHRRDGDLVWGMFITDAGKAAIGVDDADGEAAPAAQPEAPQVSKVSMVLALLQRAEGATLTELITATGWLPHTTRAALTGIRKKGHAVEKTKRDDVTCYRITTLAA